MKSNIAKYLLVAFGVIGAIAPITNTSAFKLWSLQDWWMSRSDIWSTFWKVCIQNDSFYQWYWSLIKQWYSFWSYWGSSTCINYAMGANSIFQAIVANPIGNSSSRSYFFTSLVSFESDNSWGYNFKYYDINDNNIKTFNVPSIAWFQYTLRNWQTILFDEVYFWHDTIIFMNSSSHYTLQLIWTTLLENIVIYADPFSSTENLYMIDFNLWKARSTSLSSDYVASIMFNAIDISNNLLFNEINWTNSYTLSAWSSSVFPLTAWNLCSWDGCKQSNWWYSSSMRSYNLDLNYVAPEYDLNNDPDNPNYIPIWWTAYSWYLSCFQDWTEISSFANSRNDCRSQAMSSWMNLYEFMDVEDYVLNFTWDENENRRDISNNVSCQAFMLSAKLEYDQYWSGYYSHLVSEAKKYKNSSNSLPVEAYCGSNPLTHETNTITTREDIYWESKQANSSLTWDEEDCTNWFTCTLLEYINAPKNYVKKHLIDEYSGAFHSWYNAVDFVSCPNQSYWETPYWNYVFIGVVVFLVFIFISII